MSEEQDPLLVEPLKSTDSKLHLWNVVWCGVGFQFIFLGFNTAQNFLPKLLTDMSTDVGWWSLTTLYVATVATVFFAPIVSYLLGWRLSFFISGLTFAAFVGSFIYPVVPVIYCASVLVGFGAGVIWVCNGTWIFQNSTPANRGFMNGLFWALFQISGVTGNLIAFGVFEETDTSQYWILMLFLTGSCGVGAVILLVFLRVPSSDKSILEPPSARARAKAAFDVVRTRNCWFLMCLFLFTGFDFTFTGSELPFLIDTRMVGAVLAVWGAGEILGGLFTGRLSDWIGRKPVMVMSALIFSAGLALTWLLRQFPAQSYLGFICGFLFGFSDAGLNNLVGASVNDLFPDEQQRGAWVVANVAQNVASAVGFFYSPFLPLVTQGSTVGSIWQIPINFFLLAAAATSFMFIRFPDAKKKTETLVTN